jgi:hypothetical protein
MDTYQKAILSFKNFYFNIQVVQDFNYNYNQETIDFILSIIESNHTDNPFIIKLYDVIQNLLLKNSINYDSIDLIFNKLFSNYLST